MAAGRSVVLAVAIAVLGGCGGESEGPGGLPVPRTNVLLVTIDTLRADALGAYDPSLETSPNIDALAREGVLFEQCVSSSPSTLPSHASILTGLYPFAHGVRANQGYALPRKNRTLAEVLRDEGYATAAEISATVIARRAGLDQGFALYRDPTSYDAKLKSAIKTTPKGSERISLGRRDALDVTRRGIEFLRQHRELPFFLWLHYFDVHRPHVVPPEFVARFPDSSYHASVAFTDAQLGLVIEELRRLGIGERTLVIVTSDHGDGLGEHGESTHSFFVYDSTIRIPLVFWGPPELARGRRVASPVRSIDIAPTVLDWLGLPPFEDAEGVSLAPALRGESWHRALTGYGESIEAYATFGTSILRFVREGRWKYIHKVNPELYDLEEDPDELQNRAGSEPGRLARLRERLEALIREAPSPAGEAEVSVDAETLAELEALGYVASAHRVGVTDEMAALELSGADPRDVLADVQRLAVATGLLRVRSYDEAVEVLETLLSRYPRSLPVLRILIEALQGAEREDEAVALMRRALELEPTAVGLRLQLFGSLQRKGELVEAERQARLVLEQDPCHARGLSYLSNLLHEQGRYDQQRALLKEGIERCDSVALLNDYAYMLATCPDPAHRDGAEALRLATAVTQGSEGANPAFLDTLAAAHAEAGDFESATAISRRALGLLESRETPEEVLATYRAHLETLEAGRPIRGN